jgi:hypothetical protein
MSAKARSEESTGALEAEVTQVADELPFCRDGRGFTDRDARRFCHLAPELKRCPGLRARCANLGLEQAKPPSDAGSRAAPGATGLRVANPFGPVLLILLAAVLIGALVALLLRAGLRWRGRSAPPEVPPVPEPQGATVAPTRAPVRRRADWLAEAEAHLAAGRFEEAVLTFERGLLAHLEQRELIRLHPSLTNEDYLRALKKKAEVQREVRAVFRSLERFEFGGEPKSANNVRGLRDAVRRVLAVTALLLAALSGAGCDPAEGTPPASLEDTSPAGFSALQSLLERRGAFVTAVRSKDWDAAEAAVIVVTAKSVSPEHQKHLLEFVRGGGLLVLPVTSAQDLATELAVATGETCGPMAEASGTRTLATSWSAAVVIPEERSRRVARCPSGSVFIAWVREQQGGTLVFADRDWLSNASLLAADNAATLISELGELDEVSVYVVDDFSGVGASNPAESMAHARLTPFLAQAVLVLLIAALWRGYPFGRPRTPKQSSRRAFIEHVRALGHAYGDARASRFALATYAAWALDHLRERTGATRDTGISGLAASVAKRLGREEKAVLHVFVAAELTRREPFEADQPEDLFVLRRLASFVSELGGRQ